MRAIRSNGGFSLVELLTVIAIIAILAAIIFPVMSSVRARANENNCMTNLQQIGQAVQMFKQDNRRYPMILGSQVIAPGGGPYTGGTPDMFENAKDKYLFPEYTKSSIKVFHCPSSKVANTRDIIRGYKRPGMDPMDEVYLYAYNSYDAAAVTGGGPVYDEGDGTAEMRYRVNWAPTMGDVANNGGIALARYPLTESDGPAAQKQDYERQLRWRNPPGDTLITWCSYHEDRIGSDRSRWKGNAIAVFLDGHADKYPANEMEMCKWRIRAKR